MANKHSQHRFTVKLWTATFGETFWDVHTNGWTSLLQAPDSCVWCLSVHSSFIHCNIVGWLKTKDKEFLKKVLPLKQKVVLFVLPPDSKTASVVIPVLYLLDFSYIIDSFFGRFFVALVCFGFFVRLFGFIAIFCYLHKNVSIRTLFSNLNIPLVCMRTFLPISNFSKGPAQKLLNYSELDVTGTNSPGSV